MNSEVRSFALWPKPAAFFQSDSDQSEIKNTHRINSKYLYQWQAHCWCRHTLNLEPQNIHEDKLLSMYKLLQQNVAVVWRTSFLISHANQTGKAIFWFRGSEAYCDNLGLSSHLSPPLHKPNTSSSRPFVDLLCIFPLYFIYCQCLVHRSICTVLYIQYSQWLWLQQVTMHTFGAAFTAWCIFLQCSIVHGVFSKGKSA